MREWRASCKPGTTMIYCCIIFYRRERKRDDMLILRIRTSDPLRVTRKYESKRARLLAITSEEHTYAMLYAVDEYQDGY